jgi:hypothetical protein
VIKPLNPEKYIRQVSDCKRQISIIQEDARQECIKVLKENPGGRFVDASLEEYDCDDFMVWAFDDEDVKLYIYAAGLDDEDHLVFRAFAGQGGQYREGRWCRFGPWMDAYDELYELIVTFIDLAQPATEFPFDEYVPGEGYPCYFESELFNALGYGGPYRIKDPETIEKYGFDEATKDGPCIHFVRDTPYISRGWKEVCELPSEYLSMESITEREYICMLFLRSMLKEMHSPSFVFASEEGCFNKLKRRDFLLRSREVFNVTLDVGVRDEEAFRILSRDVPADRLYPPFLLFPMSDVPVYRLYSLLEETIGQLAALVPGTTLYCALVNAPPQAYFSRKAEVSDGTVHWQDLGNKEEEALKDLFQWKNTPDNRVLDILFFSGDKYHDDFVFPDLIDSSPDNSDSADDLPW